MEEMVEISGYFLKLPGFFLKRPVSFYNDPVSFQNDELLFKMTPGYFTQRKNDHCYFLN